MSFRTTIIAGKTNHIDKDLMSYAKDFLNGNSGVVGTNDFLVTQSDPVGMSVTIGPGVIYSYYAADDTYYRHKLTDAETVLTIDANSSGSTRIDLICIKTDLTATPDADGGGIPSLVVVKGTPGAGVPATPANHDKIAEISVANGEDAIETAHITDARYFMQSKGLTNYIPLSGTTPSVNLDNGRSFGITLSGNTTLSVANTRKGHVFMIDVQQAASGGPYTLTHVAGITWMTSDGNAPALPTTASKRITFGFKCIAANAYLGYLVGQNF